MKIHEGAGGAAVKDMIERLTKLSKVGFGYDIKPEDREALQAAVAALSVSPAGVKPKPLEWGPVIDDGWDRVAKTPFGEYVISVDSDAAGGVHYLWIAGQPEDDEHHSVHKTMTAAKSAAFADYSARIMSAIEPAGVGVETPPPSTHVAGDTVAVPREVIADLYRFFHQAWEGTGRVTSEGSHGKDLLDWRQIMSNYHRQTPSPQPRAAVTITKEATHD